MSDETKDALDQALRAHYADEASAGMLVDWLLVAYGVGAMSVDDSGYYFEHTTQAPHVQIGLLDMLTKYVRGDLERDDDD